MLLINAIVASLYLVLGGISFNTHLLELNNISNATELSSLANLIFAPAGVWLAFGILFGPKSTVFGILVGQILLSYWLGSSVTSGISIALFNVLACILGYYLFHRWKLSRKFNTLRDVTLFIVLILFILQPISAVGAVAAILFLDYLPLNAMPTLWLNWWLSGVMGQLLFAPLIITWLTPCTRNPNPIKLIEIISGATAIAAIALISFSSIPSAQLLILALTYPLLIWSGVRYGIRNTTFTNAFIALLIISISASGYGFLANLSAVNRFYYLSFFIITATLSSLILFAMFDERRSLILQLTKLASTDFLTKLGNRSFFMERGEQAVAQAKRHKTDLSLAILDIDLFKKINDTYGHPVGDEVIKHIAKLCASSLRIEDTPSRVGGEEFAILLPNTNKRDAYTIIERIRLAVQSQPLVIDTNTSITVTFSAGIAQLENNESLAELFRLADNMLYKSKKTGRNQTSIHSTEPPTLSTTK